jgi:hypothetical protein
MKQGKKLYKSHAYLDKQLKKGADNSLSSWLRRIYQVIIKGN